MVTFSSRPIIPRTRLPRERRQRPPSGLFLAPLLPPASAASPASVRAARQHAVSLPHVRAQAHFYVFSPSRIAVLCSLFSPPLLLLRLLRLLRLLHPAAPFSMPASGSLKEPLCPSHSAKWVARRAKTLDFLCFAGEREHLYLAPQVRRHPDRILAAVKSRFLLLFSARRSFPFFSSFFLLPSTLSSFAFSPPPPLGLRVCDAAPPPRAML